MKFGEFFFSGHNLFKQIGVQFEIAKNVTCSMIIVAQLSQRAIKRSQVGVEDSNCKSCPNKNHS